jgi:flagellar protein FliO/FliZ
MTFLLGSNPEGIYQLLVSFIIFLFVLALCVFTTKWIAGYQRNQSLGRNIHIIESLRVGTNKSIAIIEVGGEYFLIGVGKDEISMISKVNGDNIVIRDAEADSWGSAQRFNEILSDFKSRLGKK